MCSSHGVLCLHIWRFLCYTAKSSKVVSYSFAVATYPREGTETSVVSIHLFTVSLQLIPARGRKLRAHILYFCDCRCNLSPRGDGNHRLCSILHGDVVLQLIPARGRKPVFDFHLDRRHLLQLIPARGRKLFCFAVCRGRHVATYPREGTETKDLLKKFCIAPVATYPREGTETIWMIALNWKSVVATYPREGTETRGNRPTC